MRIETDLKLDFDDVLIRPKRSQLKSRSHVDLNRTYIFRNSKKEWSGIPIMASNMDTVGRFEMAKVLNPLNLITVLNKFYKINDWKKAIEEQNYDSRFVIPSIGTSEIELEQFNEVYQLLEKKTRILMY